MSNSSTLSSSLSLSASRKPRTNFCEFTWWWWRWRLGWRWCLSPSALCQSPHTAPPLGQRPPLCGEGIFLRGKNQHTNNPNHPDHLANPTTQTTPRHDICQTIYTTNVLGSTFYTKKCVNHDNGKFTTNQRKCFKMPNLCFKTTFLAHILRWTKKGVSLLLALVTKFYLM